MTWDHVVALVDSLAWPAIVLVALFVLRRQAAAIAASLAARIRDPRTTVTVGREGVTLQQAVAEAQARHDPIIDKSRTDPEFEERLRTWLKDNGIQASVTSFLYGAQYEAARAKALADLIGEPKHT